MESQQSLNYKRIAAAIDYLRANFRSQPGLEEVAAAVHLSPAHFQRLFSEWAGVSPKQYLRYLSLDFARNILRQPGRRTLFDAALDTGLSSSSRLHELFVQIEAMTPAEYRDGGAGLCIHYSGAETPFGSVFIASTPKGICRLVFTDGDSAPEAGLRREFPNANLIAAPQPLHLAAASAFRRSFNETAPLRLHLRGTPFQLKVWEALLQIPAGELRCYGDLAQQTGKASAARAVGTAVGSNPVAFLIPCHRVIRGDGGLGGYMWGETRKQAIIGWENLQDEAARLKI